MIAPNKLYTDGSYLEKNPTWHAEDSPWKAECIIRMMARNKIAPRTICEVGCGAGEVLRQLQGKLDGDRIFRGYEISEQAFDLCKSKANDKLHFLHRDILEETNARFDMTLLIDVIEHLEDYASFLRHLKPMSHYKLLHIPLDLSVQTVLLERPLMLGRELVGHIHYFTKELALQVLRDARYDVIDYFYTPSYRARAARLGGCNTRTRIADAVREVFFPLHNDLTVRIMGEYSLMVLAR
jgi:hypothetical protein